MTKLSFEYEPLEGTLLKEAFDDIKEGIGNGTIVIKLLFNGIPLYIDKDSCYEDIHRRYEYLIYNV